MLDLFVTLILFNIPTDCRIYTPEQENHFAHVTSAWNDIFIGRIGGIFSMYLERTHC